MKAIIILANVMFFTSIMSLQAQVKATTTSGQHVLLYSDGTWKFEMDADSLHVKTDSAVATVVTPVAPVKKPKPPKVYSLECSALVDVERDLNSDAFVAVSKPLNILKDDSIPVFTVSWRRAKKGPLMWTSTIKGRPCIAADSKMALVMKDGSRYMLDTDSKPNCEGTFRLYFGDIYGKEMPLENLKNSEVSSIRLYYSKGYIDGQFDEEASKKFKAALLCLQAQR